MTREPLENKLLDFYNEATDSNEEKIMQYSLSYNKLKSISDRYQKVTVIGKGAIKDVYRCDDSRIQSLVALAELRPGLGLEYYDLFIHEAWLTASLSHPNIIKVRDVFLTQDGRPCFTMDLRGNNTLKDFVEANDKAMSINALIKVCDAVSYAHSRNIVHLDLKPENIQCDDYGEVLVCDWGLGKHLEESLENPIMERPILSSYKQKTLYGAIQGTPGYMAPEQVITESSKDQRTDVFSLGCLLYFVLSGKAPFQGNKEQILKNTKNGSYEKVKFPVKNSKGFQAIIDKSLQLAPCDRYQSVSEFQLDIYKCVSGYPVSVEPKNFIREISLFLKRHKNSVGIFLIFISILLSALFQMTKARERAKKEQERTNIVQEKLERNTEFFSTYDRTINSNRIAYNNKISDISESYYDSLLNRFLIPNEETFMVLLTHALQRDSENSLIHYNFCKAAIVRMDFVFALNTRREIPQSSSWAMIDIAQISPDHAYSRDKRPKLPELISFLKKSYDKITPKHSEILLAIVKYDWNHRKIKTIAYNEVISELLMFFNKEKSNKGYEFTRDKNTLILNNMPLVRPHSNSECISALSLLRLRTLIIDQQSDFTIDDLDRLRVKTLDLSAVEGEVIITKDVTIRDLEQIILPPNTQNLDAIKSFLKSTREYVVTF